VGFDGSKFEFSGIDGNTYNLITNKNIQLNTEFKSINNKTFIGKIGIRIGKDTIKMFSDFVVSLNGKTLHYDTQLKESGTTITITRKRHRPFFKIEFVPFSLKATRIKYRHRNYFNLQIRLRNNDENENLQEIFGSFGGILGSTIHTTSLNHDNHDDGEPKKTTMMMMESGTFSHSNGEEDDWSGNADGVTVLDGIDGTDFPDNLFSTDGQ